jgi:hypothetical protein
VVRGFLARGVKLCTSKIRITVKTLSISSLFFNASAFRIPSTARLLH